MTARRALVITKNDFREERDGGSKRTAAVVRALEKDGFLVDWIAARPFVSSREVPRISHPRQVARALRSLLGAFSTMSLSVSKWHTLRLSTAVARLCEDARYDVVVLEHSQMAPLRTAVLAPLVCIDTHNVESELLANYAASASGWRRAAAKYESGRLRKLEKTFANSFGIVVAVSPRDAKWFGSRSDDSVVVAPNGVSDEFFHVTGERAGGVVFIGHLGWRPNVDAARWISTEVWPIVTRADPDIHLDLLGKDPSNEVLELAESTISVTANVPSVVPYLAAAKVATAPLLSAGGTRIKILEALASGTPVVATPLGALGLEHLAGPALRIAETPAEFAESVLELLGSTFSRDEIRIGALPYAWNKSLAPFLSAVDRVVNTA